MKRLYLIFPLLFCAMMFVSSCSKDDEPVDDFSAIKKSWVTGTWKQKDITLGVSTTVRLPDGSSLPLVEGSSMITDPMINALLGALFGGNPFILTRNNVYVFNSSNTYEITGSTDIILANVGSSGTWQLEVYDAVLALYPSTDARYPHWINAMTSAELNLSLTLNFPGLGDVPVNLLLEKE